MTTTDNKAVGAGGASEHPAEVAAREQEFAAVVEQLYDAWVGYFLECEEIGLAEDPYLEEVGSHVYALHELVPGGRVPT